MSGLRVEFLNKRHLSISENVLALIDPTKPKIVRVFDIQTGKPAASQVEHSTEIIEMDPSSGLDDLLTSTARTKSLTRR